MAYACPVCDEPQVDAGHLADHVAFTALTGDEAHETWLDETVGDWGDLGQSALAEIVVEHAEETAFPIDFDDDEVGPHAGHDHGDGAGAGQDHGHRGPPASRAPAADDEDVRNVIDEARDMTRRMQGEDTDDSDGTEAGDDSDAEDAGSDDDPDNETQ